MMTPDTPPWKQLASPLRQPPAHQLPAAHCQHCQETLPVFISDELAGLAVDDLYAETAVHLDICAACFQEYEMLVDLSLAVFYNDEDEV